MTLQFIVRFYFYYILYPILELFLILFMYFSFLCKFYVINFIFLISVLSYTIGSRLLLDLVIPSISCAFFFTGSSYPVNECPRRSLPFRLSSASQISIGGVSTLAFPFSFVSSPGRFAF